MRRVLVVMLLSLLASTPASAHVDRGDTGSEVVRVQEHLRWFGYVGVRADGFFGPQTERAVRHFQRANGLVPDGIVGPLTENALAIRGDQVQLTDPPAAPVPADPCGEMSYYRQAAGLPAVFDQLGYRESGCDNTQVSRTGCCVGWWQNYISSHLSSQSAYRERIINECGVTQRAQILGSSPEQKMRQACVTKVVYDRSGLTPWAL